MSDDNQIVIPPSFIALFVEPGRTRPSATKEVIYERYDFCEDMASMLTPCTGQGAGRRPGQTTKWLPMMAGRMVACTTTKPAQLA
jgi:hypothetical protein